MNYVVGIFSPYILFWFIKLFATDAQVEGFTTIYFTALLPLAMLLMTVTYARDDGGSEAVGLVGIALAVIPALILHIKLMGVVNPSAIRADIISGWRMLALVFPAVSIACLNNFWAKGVGFSGFMIPWGLAVGFIPLLLLTWFFFASMAVVTFVTVCFILGLVAVAAMVIIRLVFGSPFY